MMFLGFLIFLGLLALIPPLRQRFTLRNVLAWIVSSLLIGYLTGNGGSFALVIIASLLCAFLVGLRYWYVTRRHKAKPSSAAGQS